MFKVSKVKFENDIKTAVKKSVDLLGGFKKFIKTGDVVFLKPNFNTADPYPASTDLEFLKSVIELLYEAGAKLVMIGESSTYTLNTRKVLEKYGVFSLYEMPMPPKIYVLEEGNWIKKEISKAKYLKSVSLTELLERADKVIYLPNLKTHFQARFTGALKLSVGLMKPLERVKLHLGNIQEEIAELNTLIRTDLVIMDARKCFFTKGPSEGRVGEPNLIMASDDRVAIDVEGIKIIQNYKGNDLKDISPWELAQIKRSVELGLGAKSEKDYGVVEG